MTNTKKIQVLRKELSGRYQLGNEQHNLCGRRISVTCVEDAEELFSRQVLSDPDSLEIRDERLPYWACLWPAAIVLSQLLVSKRCLNSDEKVLELGCGLGLVSAVASLKGASVTATDYQSDALKFTRMNCLQIAGVDPNIMVLDWRDPPNPFKFSIILGADLVYEARFYDPLIKCFDNYLDNKGHILFSEPNREMSQVFFDRLAYAGWQYTTILKDQDAAVYRVERAR